MKIAMRSTLMMVVLSVALPAAAQTADELIEKIVFARDREDLVATTRALDRVLLHNHYVVPQWGSGVTRTVRWNRFGRPPQMPRYAAPAFPSIWWYDEALAAKTGGNR